MNRALWMLVTFFLLMWSAGYVTAADDRGKTPQAGSGPVKDKKAGAERNGFDETAAQYLKKQRSINAELVAAHREVYKYNNPVRTPKGISMDDIVDQEGSARQAREEEQTARSKKASAEERITRLEKDIENLKQDLLKHYNGKLPKNVSDAWQTEEGYTAYLISRTK